MTARIHSAGWFLKVRRRAAIRAGGGWPGFPAVYEVQCGGMNDDDEGRLLLEVVGDDAALELAAKLQAAVAKAKEEQR